MAPIPIRIVVLIRPQPPLQLQLQPFHQLLHPLPLLHLHQVAEAVLSQRQLPRQVRRQLRRLQAIRVLRRLRPQPAIRA